MLDGRRIWLVSGSVNYARVARDQWADRIHAAKLAGFNTIETPVIWARHEPRAGHFEFTGEQDLRAFVKMIGAAGMWCILRPGPAIGADWDLGGIPPWVLDLPGVKLRTGNQVFLEACSRYLTAVSEQVRDLQVTSAGAGGPVVMVQNENAWTCGHDDQARGYLGELNRYLREGGIAVPIIDANNLWQSVEGEIDCWSGSQQLLGAMRQLTAVQPDQPRIVIDFVAGRAQTWGDGSGTHKGTQGTEPAGHGGAHSSSSSHAHVGVLGGTLERRLAEVLAGGGQFNVAPFHGGTSFGFSGGRSPKGTGSFFTSSHDQHAPLREDGSPNGSYHAVRRIATFASRFGRVLANRSTQYRPVTVDPSPVIESDEGAHHVQGQAKGDKHGKSASAGAPVSVVHSVGNQGGVAFVFGDPQGHGPRSVRLMLPDGTTLPVDLGSGNDGSAHPSVVWCLFDVHIGGRASLDYCNLSAFAVVGRVFVCFGPAGSRGVLAVNGSPIEVTVPSGKAPEIAELEGITVVVCSTEQIDTTYVSDNAIYVGVQGLTADGRPIVSAHASGKSYTKIDSEGKVSLVGSAGGANAVPSTAAAKMLVPAHEPIKLGAWSSASLSDYIEGSSARFATIPGPADLGTLGSPFGYGWYRITPSTPGAKKITVSAPIGGDRLHVFQGGKSVGLIGVGPGAEREASVNFKKGEPIVVLAENLGRFSSGTQFGERKGLTGHLTETTELKPGKPKVMPGDPLEPLTFRVPLWEMRVGDATLSDRITWTLTNKPKGSLILSFDGLTGAHGVAEPFPVRGLLLLNDKPIEYVDRSGPRTVTIDAELLARGKNVIQLAMMPDAVSADGMLESIGSIEHALKVVGDAVTFSEVKSQPSAKADWAFAKWEPPASSMYAGKGAKTLKSGSGAGSSAGSSGGSSGGPTWWKSHFTYTPVAAHPIGPLYLDLSGMSKGQIYLNGKHLGRYFVETGEGKAVGPQARAYIPGPWLRAGENDLVLFDEHSAAPTKVKLVFGEQTPITARV